MEQNLILAYGTRFLIQFVRFDSPERERETVRQEERNKGIESGMQQARLLDRQLDR